MLEQKRETGQVEDKIKQNLNPFVHKNTIPRTKDTNVLDRYLQLISSETERVSKSREKPKSFSPRVCFPLVLQCPLLFPASVDRTTPHCLSNYLNSKQYYLKIKWIRVQWAFPVRFKESSVQKIKVFWKECRTDENPQQEIARDRLHYPQCNTANSLGECVGLPLSFAFRIIAINTNLKKIRNRTHTLNPQVNVPHMG